MPLVESDSALRGFSRVYATFLFISFWGGVSISTVLRLIGIRVEDHSSGGILISGFYFGIFSITFNLIILLLQTRFRKCFYGAAVLFIESFVFYLFLGSLSSNQSYRAPIVVLILSSLWTLSIYIHRNSKRWDEAFSETFLRASTVADPLASEGEKFSSGLDTKQALACSALRPHGRIKIGNSTYTARTNGTWVESGSPVQIVGNHNGEFIVEPLGHDVTKAERTK